MRFSLSLRAKDTEDPILNLEQGRSVAGWGRMIFYVADVDAPWEYLRGKGLNPESPRDASWGERYFHMSDPDGNELSFARPIGSAVDRQGARHRGTLHESAAGCAGTMRGRKESNPDIKPPPADSALTLWATGAPPHDYKRHGVTSLFAALDIATGGVLGKCYRRHRAVEFLNFLKEIDKTVPAELDLHLVLDAQDRPGSAVAAKEAALSSALHPHSCLLAESS
jgi:hypothetical protein